MTHALSLGNCVGTPDSLPNLPAESAGGVWSIRAEIQRRCYVNAETGVHNAVAGACDRGDAAVTSIGAGKVLSASSDRKESKQLNEEGEEKFRRAEKRLQRARANCEDQRKALGQLEFEVRH